MRRSAGFSLLECVIAVFVTAVAILSVVGLTLRVFKTAGKAEQSPQAWLAAGRVLERTLYQVENDLPPGTRASFWSADSAISPWRSGSLTLGATEFQYSLYAQTVSHALSGLPLGSSGNRLKKVDVVVWWWGSDRSSREGYGRLRAEVTRLVHETSD